MPVHETTPSTFNRSAPCLLVKPCSSIVEWNKKDRYGRTLGKVLVDGQDVGYQQIKDGFAWWYKKYSSDQQKQERDSYSLAESQAMMHRYGLWNDRNPIPPWDWRRGINTED